MKSLQRVVWSKGLLLGPQHFQAQDQYFEDSLQFRFSASNFANWGFRDLSFDLQALQNGYLRINRCSGVMPDGLVFDMPASDDLPAGRELQSSFAVGETSLAVFLAIQESRQFNVTFREGAVGAGTVDKSTRYLSEIRLLRDWNDGSEERPIQIAKKSFHVLFGGEMLDGFTIMPVAQVTRNSVGAFVLNPCFVPPCLDIASSEFLMSMLRREVEVLAARAAYLGGARRQQSRSMADFRTSEVATFWLLQIINSCLPELKHIFNAKRGHPEPLFVAMLRLAGGLSTFSMQTAWSDLPTYDHSELSSCFGALDDLILSLLSTVMPSTLVALPLEPAQRNVWSANIPQDSYFQASQWVIAVAAAVPAQQLVEQFPRLAKVAAADQIQQLLAGALPGVSLQHLPNPPSAIPLRFDNEYFRLTTEGPLWDGMKRSRNLSVFVPGDIVDPKMELIVAFES